MTKLKANHNQKTVIVVPVLLVILLVGFLTYSFANFKSIKGIDMIGSYFVGNSYTLSYNVANCTSKTIKNGKAYGELCTPPIPDDYLFDGWYNGDTKILATDNVRTNSNITLTAHFVPDCVTLLNRTYNFYYNGTSGIDGSEQNLPILCPGLYEIEAWGGAGGSKNYEGAYGAYTKGSIYLNSGETLYINVGGKGVSEKRSDEYYLPGGYNGGGAAIAGQGSLDRYFSSGGGASDIRLVSGAWNNIDSLKSRIMVAGAGGGYWYEGSTTNAGGAAGGLVGYDGVGTKTYTWGSPGSGGSQTEPGSWSCSRGSYNCSSSTSFNNYNKSGSFGAGGSSEVFHSGGGSGYFGGGGSAHVQSGGGGSSFISGYKGCVAISASTSSINNIIIRYGSGGVACTNGTTDYLCGNHYSNYVFTNTTMIDGKGCNRSSGAAANCGNNQIQPNGTYATGHADHGHVRIKFTKNVKYLYYFGNEFEDITGGYRPTVDQANGAVEKLSNSLHIYYSTRGTSGSGFWTNNAIDYTGYSKINIEYEIRGIAANSDPDFRYLRTNQGTFTNDNTTGYYVSSINVSNADTALRIFNFDSDMYIYKIWLSN